MQRYDRSYFRLDNQNNEKKYRSFGSSTTGSSLNPKVTKTDSRFEKNSNGLIQMDQDTVSILNVKLSMNYGISVLQLFPIRSIVVYLFEKYLRVFEEETLSALILKCIQDNFENDSIKQKIQNERKNSNKQILNKNDGIDPIEKYQMSMHKMIHNDIKQQKTYRKSIGSTYEHQRTDQIFQQYVYKIFEDDNQSNQFTYVCLTHGQYNSICELWNNKKIKFLSKLYDFIRDYNHTLDQLRDAQKNKIEDQHTISKKKDSNSGYKLITSYFEKKEKIENVIDQNLKNMLSKKLISVFKEEGLKLRLFYNELEENRGLNEYLEKLDELFELCFDEVSVLNEKIKKHFDLDYYFKQETSNFNHTNKKSIIDMFKDMENSKNTETSNNMNTVKRIKPNFKGKNVIIVNDDDDSMDIESDMDSDILNDREYLVEKLNDHIDDLKNQYIDHNYTKMDHLLNEMYDCFHRSMFSLLYGSGLKKSKKTKSKPLNVELFRCVKYVSCVSKRLWGFSYQDTLQKKQIELNLLKAHEILRFNNDNLQFFEKVPTFIGLFEKEKESHHMGYLRNDWRLSNMRDNIDKMNEITQSFKDNLSSIKDVTEQRRSSRLFKILKMNTQKYSDIFVQMHRNKTENEHKRTHTSFISVNSFVSNVDPKNIRNIIYTPGSFQALENGVDGCLISHKYQALQTQYPQKSIKTCPVYSKSFISAFSSESESLSSLKQKQYDVTVSPIEFNSFDPENNVLNYIISCMIAGGLCLTMMNMSVLKIIYSKKKHFPCVQDMCLLFMENNDSNFEIKDLVKNMLSKDNMNIGSKVHRSLIEKIEMNPNDKNVCLCTLLAFLRKINHKSIEKFKTSNKKRLRSDIDDMVLIENERESKKSMIQSNFERDQIEFKIIDNTNEKYHSYDLVKTKTDDLYMTNQHLTNGIASGTLSFDNTDVNYDQELIIQSIQKNNEKYGSKILDMYERLHPIPGVYAGDFVYYNEHNIYNFVFGVNRLINSQCMIGKSIQFSLLQFLLYYKGDKDLIRSMCLNNKLYVNPKSDDSLINDTMTANHEIYMKKKALFQHVNRSIRDSGVLSKNHNIDSIKKKLLEYWEKDRKNSIIKEETSDFRFMERYAQIIYFPKLFSEQKPKKTKVQRPDQFENLRQFAVYVEELNSELDYLNFFKENLCFENNVVDVLLRHVQFYNDYMNLNENEKHNLKHMITHFMPHTVTLMHSVLTDYRYSDGFNIVMIFDYFKDIYLEDIFVTNNINEHRSTLFEESQTYIRTIIPSKFYLDATIIKFNQNENLHQLVMKLFTISKSNVYDSYQLTTNIKEFIISILFFTRRIKSENTFMGSLSELSNNYNEFKKLIYNELFSNVETLEQTLKIVTHSLPLKYKTCETWQIRMALCQILRYILLDTDYDEKNIFEPYNTNLLKTYVQILLKENIKVDVLKREQLYCFMRYVFKCCNFEEDQIQAIKQLISEKNDQSEQFVSLCIELEIF